jgi:hypothetical protein
MTRYLKVLSILAVAIAALAALPTSAGAGCPGCEEYTLDIPEDDPAPAPAPAPATGTAPAAPVAPAAPAEPATPTAPGTEVPTTEAPIASEESTPRPEEPQDTDDDPVPGGVAEPPRVASVPAVSASQAGDLESSNPGGVLPLAIALVAVAIAGAALRVGGQRAAARERP